MSNKKEAREILSARISAESYNGWKRFCISNGVSLTAFIEVAGLELAKEPIPPQTKVRLDMVSKAREIDIARRSRK